MDNEKNKENPLCPKCGSSNVRKKGSRKDKQRYLCLTCMANKPDGFSGWFTLKIDGYDPKSKTYEFNINETSEYTEYSGEAESLEDLIKKADIDLNVWYIYEYSVKDNRWDTTMKVRTYNSNENGNYIEKEEPVTTTNHQYHIVVKLKRKVDIIDIQKFRDEMIEDFKDYSPKISKYTCGADPVKEDSSYFLLINNFDFHFGKYIFDKYNTKIASDLYVASVAYHLHACKDKNVNHIILPVGNDLFNSDYSYIDGGAASPHTRRGTPQQEDMSWQEIFRIARQTIMTCVNMCLEVAPVTLIRVPGNHDFTKSFYLMDALECFYHNNENVEVINQRGHYNYYSLGNVLMGFAHEMPKGTDGTVRLLTKMQQDVPIVWSNTKYHEWFLGHIHHEKTVKITMEDDVSGIMVRYMRTPMPKCDWEDEMMYTSNKGTNSFLYHYTDGIVRNNYFNLH